MTTESTTRRPWTADDLFAVRGPSDARISPDGNRVAYVVGERYTDGTKAPKSRIWMVSTSGGDAREYTRGPRSDHSPRWSPDGETLAFLSDREEDGRFGIYTVPMEGGGEALPLCETAGSVVDLAWSPDGAHVAFIMTDPRTEEEKRREEAKRDAVVFEESPKYQRLWVVGANGTGLRQVTQGDVQVWELAWFPDGERLALIVSALPFEWSWYEASVARVPLSGGEVAAIYSKAGEQVALPRPAPDGESVAFISAIWSDRGAVGGDVLAVPAGGGEARNLTEGYGASFGCVEWLHADGLVAIGYEDGEGAIFTLGADAPPAKRWRAEAAFADRHWARFSLAGDRRTLALIREDHLAPADVWTVTRAIDDTHELEWTRLTHQQPHLEELARPEARTMRWTSPDGTPVQGILLLPERYEAGERYPLVTIVHGGPTALYSHGYPTSYFAVPLLTAASFAVLLPNPRGSTGWGRAYAEANLGDMGGGDLADVLSGVDAAVESGVADPERLGLFGWSYGGYMAAWTVTQTQRFKAAIMGAGISNWRSFHGTSNLPTWDKRYLRADPQDVGGAYDRWSPVTHADAVRTPTLILHGERDPYVPVGQAYEFHRALSERGIEVHTVVYPREGHGIQERAHARDLMGRITSWFGERL